MQFGPWRTPAVFKAALLVFILCGAVSALWTTSLGDTLNPDAVTSVLTDAGAWAPVLFILVYAIGVCLFVPAILFCTVGAVFFGTTWGFVYIWLGAMLGASLGFFMARALGRDFVASLLGGRLQSYDDAIERNGFVAVLYVRFLYAPFTPANLSMGLTKVHFRDYLLATGIGIVMGTFLFVFLVDIIKSAWTAGDWSRLWSLRVFVGTLLFAVSLSFPVLLKRRQATSLRVGNNRSRQV